MNERHVGVHVLAGALVGLVPGRDHPARQFLESGELAELAHPFLGGSRKSRWGDWSPPAPVQASTRRSLPWRSRSCSRTSCQKSALTAERPSTSCDGQATLIAVAIEPLVAVPEEEHLDAMVFIAFNATEFGLIGAAVHLRHGHRRRRHAGSGQRRRVPGPRQPGRACGFPRR